MVLVNSRAYSEHVQVIKCDIKQESVEKFGNLMLKNWYQEIKYNECKFAISSFNKVCRKLYSSLNGGNIATKRKEKFCSKEQIQYFIVSQLSLAHLMYHYKSLFF